MPLTTFGTFIIRAPKLGEQSDVHTISIIEYRRTCFKGAAAAAVGYNLEEVTVEVLKKLDETAGTSRKGSRKVVLMRKEFRIHSMERTYSEEIPIDDTVILKLNFQIILVFLCHSHLYTPAMPSSRSTAASKPSSSQLLSALDGESGIVRCTILPPAQRNNSRCSWVYCPSGVCFGYLFGLQTSWTFNLNETAS